MQWVGIVPDSEEVLTHDHHLINNRTDTTCRQIKMGMAACLGVTDVVCMEVFVCACVYMCSRVIVCVCVCMCVHVKLCVCMLASAHIYKLLCVFFYFPTFCEGDIRTHSPPPLHIHTDV